MFKLYELSDGINQVAQLMEQGVEGLEDTLESLDESFQQKAEGCIRLMRSKLAEADAIGAEIQRLKSMQDKLVKDARWLNEYVEREMINSNMSEVKSNLFKIKLSMTPPRVEVLDQSLIPERYIRTTVAVSPDKMAIKEALKKGETVPGVEIKQDLKLSVK